MKGGYGGSRSSPYGGNVGLTQFKGKQLGFERV